MVDFPDKFDLYCRELVLKNSGKIQKIYFFALEGKTPKSGIKLSDKTLPAGYTVAYGHNGHPFLKKLIV